jgi:hypothetical protein
MRQSGVQPAHPRGAHVWCLCELQLLKAVWLLVQDLSLLSVYSAPLAATRCALPTLCAVLWCVLLPRWVCTQGADKRLPPGI